MNRPLRILMLAVGAVLLAGLLLADARAQGVMPKVRLLFPTEGMSIPAGDVTVRMVVTGAELKPADGTHTPGTGHFHLYLDKVPERSIPIPNDVAGIWHTPTATFVIKKVTPGVHTLMLVWAYGDHIPFAPWVSDTIMFEAR